MSGYPRSMTAAPNYSSSPYRPPLQQSRYGTGQAAPPSPAISSEDRHLSESMSKMSFNPPPSPPSSTRTTDSRDAAMVFHTWPVVFDILDPVNPVMRLELELLFLALARFLVIPPASFEELVKPVPRADGWQCCCWECKQCKEISPQNSLCVCPAKLQRFYEIFSVSNDENWSEVFDKTPKEISRIFTTLYCHHHFVPEDRSFTPTIPALTPQGFVAWMRLQVLAHPEREMERLCKAVQLYPIHFPGTQERFPELDPSVFPIGQWDSEHFLNQFQTTVTGRSGTRRPIRIDRGPPPVKYTIPRKVTLEEEADPESHGPEGPGYAATDIVMEAVDTSAQADIASAALETLRERSRLERERAKLEKMGKQQEVSRADTTTPRPKSNGYGLTGDQLQNAREQISALPKLNTSSANPIAVQERARQPYARRNDPMKQRPSPTISPQMPRQAVPDRHSTYPSLHSSYMAPHSINTSNLPPRSRTVSTPTRSSFGRRDSYGSHPSYGTPPLTPASSQGSGRNYQMASNFSPPLPPAPHNPPQHSQAPQGYFFPKPRALHYEPENFAEPEQFSDPETEDFVESPDPYGSTNALGRYGYYEDDAGSRGSGSALGSGGYGTPLVATPGPYGGGYSAGAIHSPPGAWSDRGSASGRQGSTGSQPKEEAWADYC